MTIRWAILGTAVRAASPVGVALAGVLVAALAATAVGWFRASQPKEVIQHTGYFLEFLGAGCVLYGIVDTQRRYKRPSLRATVARWFSLIASAFKQPIHASLGATLGHATATGAAATLSVAPAPVTIEERLAVLEKSVKDLRTQATATREELREEIRALKREVEQERRERKEADERAMHDIEDQAVGGVALEALGLFWAVVGILLTNPWLG